MPPVPAQNRCVFPLSKLPEEVLTAVFESVVFGRQPIGDSPLWMDQEVKLIYRRLYNLLGVCSTWRRILMTGQVFWSVVPMIPGRCAPDQDHFRRCLERAGGHKLHLAASVESSSASKNLAEVLTEYGPQFHAVQLSAGLRKMNPALRDALSALLQHSAPSSLSKLSIEFVSLYDLNWCFPQGLDYIFPQESLENALFQRLLGTLSAFHVTGAHFHWDTILFSSRLVELQISNIGLGYDEKILPFLQTLSSASKLRDLKLISIVSFHHRSTRPNANALPTVAFPKLQSLHLQDLHFNTLEFLLTIIAPGSHDLTLSLTERSIFVATPEEDDFEYVRDKNGNAEKLCAIVKTIPVNTLMITGRRQGTWLSEKSLECLLNALPALKTFMVDSWELCGPVCNILRCTPASLEKLVLCSVTFSNMDGFRELVLSRPLREVILGGTIEVDHPNRKRRREEIKNGSKVVSCLTKSRSNFYIVDSLYSPPEFHYDVWQLW